jgi:hypothetical protein
VSRQGKRSSAESGRCSPASNHCTERTAYPSEAPTRAMDSLISNGGRYSTYFFENPSESKTAVALPIYPSIPARPIFKAASGLAR